MTAVSHVTRFTFSITCPLVMLLILIPPGGICNTLFDEILEECGSEDISTTHLCLLSLPLAGFITLYRKKVTSLGEGTGIIAKITPSATNGLAEVTLVGGRYPELNYIAFGISDRARGAMGAGIPAVICMYHRKDHKTKVYFLGTRTGAFFPTPFDPSNLQDLPIGGKIPEDFFRDGYVEEKKDTGGMKVIICKFNMTNKMWKLDFTELDLAKSLYNVVFAQGRIAEGEHQQNDPETLRPLGHNTMQRYVSTAKYFLHQSSSAQSHILDYLKCGIEDYCIGAGFDGCGSSSFDCKFFVKFTWKSPTTLGVILRGTTFKSFIGVGFSKSANIIPAGTLARWNGLKFIAICDTGSSSPSITPVECDQKDEKDRTHCKPSSSSTSIPLIQSSRPIVHEMVMNSNDEKVDALSCGFDLVFSGDSLEMMKSLGTRLLIGGNSGGSSELFKLLKLPVDHKFLFFSASENAALLKENETSVPLRGVWEIVKWEQDNITDPGDLIFEAVGGSVQVMGLNLPQVVTAFILIISLTY